LPSSYPILQEVQSTLAANPQVHRLRVEGHTDSAGRAKKNLDLSKRRARSVARWLIDRGTPADRLEAYGCGQVHPIADNKTKSGKQANRRVEFHVTDPSPREVRDTTGCEPIGL
jgi:outer membrane protein OmpA-like peptidoglycan-associated protein